MLQNLHVGVLLDSAYAVVSLLIYTDFIEYAGQSMTTAPESLLHVPECLVPGTSVSKCCAPLIKLCI